MRKELIAALLLLSLFIFHLSPLQAQTQSGTVRTVTRPDAPSTTLQGVVVRLQGDYNPVMTDENGAFQVLMPGMKNGAPYAVAGINKGGFELREPELVGRQLPFSTSVPLEIVMVSRRQLQRDKQRIEQAARENIERYYEEQMNRLNAQLAQATLTNQEYEQRLSALETEYDRFEPLIEQMADRYARTDYTGLTETDRLIQQAIEQGDLNLAQQQILAKGDPAERERKIRRVEQLAQLQRDELAEDYYHLYSIHLTRMQNDSALHFLLRRAELDTTNAQWQLDAGAFYDLMDKQYDKALVLFRRALRYAEFNEGPNALRTAQAHNNIACALSNLQRHEEALPEHHMALDLYTRIYGAEHELTAARLTNIGVTYFQLAQPDSAQAYFSRAEAIYDAITQPDDAFALAKVHAQLLSNQATVDAHFGQLGSAYERLLKGLQIVPKQHAEQTQIELLKQAGVVAYMLQLTDDAASYWKQALDLALPFYGAQHTVTAELLRYIDEYTPIL